MHWIKSRRSQRLKQKATKRNPSIAPYLTYEEMLEIAAEREGASSENERYGTESFPIQDELSGNDGEA
jgi:hypothetical protein